MRSAPTFLLATLLGTTALAGCAMDAGSPGTSAGEVDVYDAKTDRLVSFTLFFNVESEAEYSATPGVKSTVTVSPLVHDIDKQKQEFTVDAPMVNIGKITAPVSVELDQAGWWDETDIWFLLAYKHPAATRGNWAPAMVHLGHTRTSLFQSGTLSRDGDTFHFEGDWHDDTVIGDLDSRLVPSDSEFGLMAIPVIKSKTLGVFGSDSLEGERVDTDMTISTAPAQNDGDQG